MEFPRASLAGSKVQKGHENTQEQTKQISKFSPDNPPKTIEPPL